MKNKINSLCLATSLILASAVVPGLTGCDRNRADRGEKDRPATDRTTGELIDDKALTARVKVALSDNPDYKFGDVIVTVLKGTMQLSGFVNTAEQKTKAGEIAKNAGVKDVENKITVK